MEWIKASERLPDDWDYDEKDDEYDTPNPPTYLIKLEKYAGYWVVFYWRGEWWKNWATKIAVPVAYWTPITKPERR